MADYLGVLLGGPTTSPLDHDLWLQWNQEMWGLTPERVRYTVGAKALPALEGVLYLDRKGRARMPPLNPHLPFRLRNTGTTRNARLHSQWLSVAFLLASDLRRRGLVGRLVLPPGLLDARPFQWLGMQVTPRYTYTTPLPADLTTIDGSIRTSIRRSLDAGYTAERSTDWSSIHECLMATETRKAFSHGLTVKSIARAAELLGTEMFRGYLVRDRNGEAASGGIRLLSPNGLAIDWVQGTVRGRLSSGVGQLIESFALNDLQAAGAMSFDFGGANIESIARAKADWGFSTVPYLSVTSPSWRNLAIAGASTARWRTSRRVSP